MPRECKCSKSAQRAQAKSGAVSVVIYDLRSAPLDPQVVHELEEAVDRITAEYKLISSITRN